MKIDKKKITFAVVIGAVLIFIIAYSILAFGGDDNKKDQLSQPLVPALEIVQEDYNSRLDAVDNLKEVRETNAPSIYDEKYLDSAGVFDPNFIEKEKMRLVDSIYTNGRINYSKGIYRNPNSVRDSVVHVISKKQLVNNKKSNKPPVISTKEMGLEQQLFFASNPLPQQKFENSISIKAIIDTKQVVKVNDHIEIRTQSGVTIDGHYLPKNTTLYGVVSFKPNRVLLKIENVGATPFAFQAYDIRDGLEGIYIKNSFQEELRQQVISDVIDDIDIPGVPQVRGIKKIFQRSNRNVKVTVNNNYKLILKPVNRK